MIRTAIACPRGRKVTVADLDRRQAERESFVLGMHGAMKPSRAIAVPAPPVSTTTRRFPRSLADAFPDERASCIDVPQRPLSRMGGIAIGITVVLALFSLAYKMIGPA